MPRRPTPVLPISFILSCALLSAGCLFAEEADSKAKAIQDNSFFVEEAYNQEPGVVQHIFNAAWSVDKLNGDDDRAWTLVFTQEWPLFSQKHQLSYTLPYSFLDGGGESEDGLQDILLNYRFQLFAETERLPAFAPRFSLILPTGDEDEGFGNDTLGYQFNFPISKVVAESWTVHLNAGLTFLPDVDTVLDSGEVSPERDLLNTTLAASAIYAPTTTLNLMLEFVGNWDEDFDDTGGLDRTFVPLVSPGARYALNFSSGAQIVIGVAVPLGLRSEAPDYGLFIYLSIEHSFLKP